MAEFNKAIDIVLKHEGGFVNDKIDPGGATKYGLSLRYLRTIEKSIDIDLDDDGDVDAQDVKNIPVQLAAEIYKKWWDKYNFSRFKDQSLATKVFDIAINMGQKQAIKLLQRACNLVGHNVVDKNLVADGMLGSQTFNRVNQLNAERLLVEYREICADFYLTLINKNPALKKFEIGWLRRSYS